MDFSKFEEKDLTKPRDKGWNNFIKFENVGDKVSGIIRDVFYQPADEQFSERRVFTLEQSDGTFANVSIKRNPYFAIRPTDDLHIGDLLTVELAELRESKVKSYHPTKIYSFTAGIDPNAPKDENDVDTRPTVKELEAIDMVETGSASSLNGDTPLEQKEGTQGEETSEDLPFN